MKNYELKHFCNKCKKELKWQLNSDFDLEDSDIERFTKELAQRHDHDEHTHCTGCGIKIIPKEAQIEIIGRQDPTAEEAKKGVAFTMLFGHYCQECFDKIQKAKKTNK